MQFSDVKQERKVLQSGEWFDLNLLEENNFARTLIMYFNSNTNIRYIAYCLCFD